MTIGRKTIEARGLVGTAKHETIRHRGMRMGLPHHLTQKHPRGALQLPFLPKAAESRFMTIGSKRIRSRGLARLSREPTSFTSSRAHELTSRRAHEPSRASRAHELTSSRASRAQERTSDLTSARASRAVTLLNSEFLVRRGNTLRVLHHL